MKKEEYKNLFEEVKLAHWNGYHGDSNLRP